MDEVILVDEYDQQVGSMEKMEVHKKGLLHRAFSVFIFNDRNEMLLQQRATSKYHSGGLWTNACCSHPRPGEETEAAALRRLQEELGFTTSLSKIFDFKYNAAFDNGLTEHEFDHVYLGSYSGKITPVTSEVKDYCYIKMDELKATIKSHPHRYTAWFCIAFPKVEEWFSNHKSL